MSSTADPDEPSRHHAETAIRTSSSTVSHRFTNHRLFLGSSSSLMRAPGLTPLQIRKQHIIIIRVLLLNKKI